MATEPKTVYVLEGSELARVLDEASDAPLRLVRGGAVYRVNRDADDLWADYDPHKARAGMRAGAGTLTPDQGAELKQHIYQVRELGSRPADRPGASWSTE